MTNREILKVIAEELDQDGELDEEANVLSILDMGAIHDGQFTFAYGAVLSNRVLEEKLAAVTQERDVLKARLKLRLLPTSEARRGDG